MAGSGGSEDSDDLSHLARPVETEEPAAVLSPAPEHGKPFTAKGKGKRPEPYSGKSSHGPFMEKGKNSYPGKGKTPLLVPFGRFSRIRLWIGGFSSFSETLISSLCDSCSICPGPIGGG